MILPDLDKLAVWQPRHREGLRVKPFKNYKYLKDGQVTTQTDRPVYRYAKSYEVGDKVAA